MKWLPVLIASLLCACANAPQSPEHSPAKAKVNDGAKPLVVQNADGTMTIQREGAQGKEGRGLVIKPQVVVPTTPPSRDN